MSNVKRRYWILGIVACVAMVIVPVLYAGGLVERDQRRLDRAREAHAQEVERAIEIYTTRVQRANETLERVYGQLITRYEQRGERGIAQELRRELDELTGRALNIEDNLDGHESDDAARYEQLIEAVGPALVDAHGRTTNSGELAEASYVILFFSAQWCGPCRHFTPELIEFHQQHSQRSRVAVIYISSDRSADQMMRYLRSSNMPWHAVPHDRVDQSGLKQRFNSRGGIPKLVVLGPDGAIVMESGSGGSPSQVLRELAQRL